jgi:hypothetical protein
LCKINADSISAVESRWPDTLITSATHRSDYASGKLTKEVTVNAAFDPDISMFITSGSVTSEEQTRVGL